MNNVLTKANRQWESRPADERFGSLQAMHDAASRARTGAAVAKIKANALRVTAEGDDLRLIGESRRASLTHWSFGQIAERAKAPAAYLRSLPATIG